MPTQCVYRQRVSMREKTPYQEGREFGVLGRLANGVQVWREFVQEVEDYASCSTQEQGGGRS